MEGTCYLLMKIFDIPKTYYELYYIKTGRPLNIEATLNSLKQKISENLITECHAEEACGNLSNTDDINDVKNCYEVLYNCISNPSFPKCINVGGNVCEAYPMVHIYCRDLVDACLSGYPLEPLLHEVGLFYSEMFACLHDKYIDL